jgi:hypothetical protein
MPSNQQTIGGRQYSFGTIPAMEAIHVEVSIAKVIGEPLFKAFMDTKKTGVAKEDAKRAGVLAIGQMAAKMDAEDITKTMTTVFKYVSCDGKRVEIDAHFTGRPKELWEVFLAALRFNFSDFLPEDLSSSLQEELLG